MTTESNEQYRAGFEAWAEKEHPEAHAERRANGEYKHRGMREWWAIWTASKLEASTESSADLSKLKRYAIDYVEQMPDEASDGEFVYFADVQPLIAAGAGALPDEALRLALDALQAAQRNHGVMLTSYPPQDAWVTRGVDSKIREAIAAIEAQAKAGKA